MELGISGKVSSTTLEGIAPLAVVSFQLSLMTWPEGLCVAIVLRSANLSISGLYSFSTRKFDAFGCGVFDSHQTYSTESLIRTLRTVTHSAGTGIFAGLYQKQSCARWNPICSTKAISTLK